MLAQKNGSSSTKANVSKKQAQASQPPQTAQQVQRRRRVRKARRSGPRVYTRGAPSISEGVAVIPRPKGLNFTQAEADKRMITIPTDMADQPPAVSWVKCLTGPKYNKARIPDAFGGQAGTCLFSSTVISEQAVTIDTSNTQTGRGAILVQPILGDITKASRYKIAQTLPNTNFLTANWYDSTPYAQLYGDQDLRLDAFYPNMTSPNPGFAMWTRDATNSTGLTPFGNGGGVPSNFSYLYRMIPAGIVVGQYNWYQLPLGVFYVSIAVGGTGISSIDIVPDPVRGSDVSVTYNGAAIGATDQTLRSSGAFITVNGSLGQINITTNGSSVTMATLTISPAFANGVPLAPNSGVITTLRPTGMSVWGSYINSTFFNAGQVSIALVPPDSCKKAFFQNVVSTWPGQLQFYEKLGELQGSYTGRLDDGVYCWWSPMSRQDTNFYTPEQMNSRDYPCIIAAFQFQPNGIVADGQTLQVFKWEITTVYEFQTMTILWQSEVLLGNEVLLDSVLQLVGQAQHAGANGSHLEFIKGMAERAWNLTKRLGVFAWENREPFFQIGKAALTAAALV
jgi:hypothetical protein